MITELYLSDPNLLDKVYPAGGSEQLCIDFIGGPYLFSGLSDTQIDLLTERYGDLCLAPLSTTQPAVRTDVYKTDRKPFTSEWPADEYALDVLHEPDHIDIAGWFFCGRIHTAPLLHGDLLICADETRFFLGAFENFFRVLVAYRMLELGGVLLHSAGIVDRGRASIFCGVSGAGKSTLSRKALSEGKTVLSDDLNALILEGDRVIVSPVPFAGDLGQQQIKFLRCQVNGIFRLQQGDQCEYRSLKKGRFLTSALVCLPFVNTNRFVTTRLEDNLLQLSSIIATGEVTTQANTPFSQVLQCIEAAHEKDQEREL